MGVGLHGSGVLRVAWRIDVHDELLSELAEELLLRAFCPHEERNGERLVETLQQPQLHEKFLDDDVEDYLQVRLFFAYI